MKNYPSLRHFFLSALWGICCLANAQSAPMALKTGEQIYKQACVACHASGVAKAPKFGDNKAWAPLIAEGQPMLTAHAWVGVRGMPAKGGQSDLSLEDFAKTVAYMARSSGGNWQDPDQKMMTKIRKEEQLRIAKLQTKQGK